MWNVRLGEAQAEIKTARRNINNLRYAHDTTLMAESEEELRSLLIKVKEESEKVGLKLNIQKTKIMASSPITSWQIVGENMETVRDFIFLGSKITADGNCSHEIKRHSLLGRKPMTNLDLILKSRDITLPTKVRLVKAVVFSAVMYGLRVTLFVQDVTLQGKQWKKKNKKNKESWAPKNWCFWTVVLKTLESPLDCKEIQPVHPKENQSWIFIGNTDSEAETLILWPSDAKKWLIEPCFR